MNAITQNLGSSGQLKVRLFFGLSLLILCSSFFSIAMEEPLIMAFPILFLVILTGLYRPKFLVYLLFAVIPMSIEFSFTDSLATDLPTEPLMVGLSLLFLLWSLFYPEKIKKGLFTHPLSLLLILHLSWILFSTLYSEHFIIGLKYTAAKWWYMTALFLIPLYWFKPAGMLQLIKICCHITLPLAVFILIKHGLEDFSFEAANFVMYPLFRNHVIYAVYLLILVPFVRYFWIEAEKGSAKRWYYTMMMIVFVVALYFNYTRAAHIGLLALLPLGLLVHFRFTKIAITAALAGVLFLTTWVGKDNKFLDFAPEYENTIAHENFEDLLTATLKGKDVSTMERVYRWVAGFYMIKERPWTGWGPGSFYESYKPYTVTSFRTYVSDNPERSGIHCYYLMIFTEQGFIGLLIYLMIIFYVLSRVETLYHLTKSKKLRNQLMLVFFTVFSISLIQLINDTLESDKCGPFFFLCLALLVHLDVKISKEHKNSALSNTDMKSVQS